LEIQWPDLIDLTYDMIFVIDQSGMIKFANQAASEALLYSKKEFLNMNLKEILFEAEKFIEILDSIIASADEKDQGKFQNKEVDLAIIKQEIGYQDLILISKDTNLKIIIANFQARMIEIGGKKYFLLVLRDITDRKFLEQELFKLTENLEDEVQKKTIELQNKNQMLERLATIDTLTNLTNIRKFRELLKLEHERVVRMMNDEDVESYFILMLDIDHFKYYNDTFGHQVGDEVIKKVGETLQEAVRKIDTVGRYGGDEYIILLPETSYLAAIKTCFRIRELIRSRLKLKGSIKEILNTDTVKIDKTHKVSMSIGGSKFTRKKTLDQVINEADTALYHSKEAGRNCVHMLHKKQYIRISEETFNPKDFKK
jgi:diguanylate cyclase (GGDEF)-like protein